MVLTILLFLSPPQEGPLTPPPSPVEKEEADSEEVHTQKEVDIKVQVRRWSTSVTILHTA
jgi:hypothetical protein